MIPAALLIATASLTVAPSAANRAAHQCHPTTLCQPIDLPHAPEAPSEAGFKPPAVVITSSSSAPTLQSSISFFVR
jgi:hypothetical protein